MTTLPSELWVIIFDMVMVEEIVPLDQSDHTTFPYEHVFLSPREDRYRVFRSYHRLRLVCRSFNAMLGTGPYCDLHISSFPFPSSTRALRVMASDESHKRIFRQILADPSRCERLLCLDVSCWLDHSSSQPSLSCILNAGEAGAFPNVQRLILGLSVPHMDNGNQHSGSA